MFKTIKRSPWLAMGAGLGYLFDPVSGKGRRARLRDQIAARFRHLADFIGRKARYQMGRLWGGVYEAVSADTDWPRDDEHLLQKVRSEAVGPTQGVDHIEISVENGVVTLEGTSRDRVREQELIDRIMAVTGVRSVRNELTAVAAAG